MATGESVSVHVDGDGPAPLPDAGARRVAPLRIGGPAAARPERGPARLVRENYPFRLDMRTRFGDLDTNRHVNNVALAGWYLDALAELHLDVLGYPIGGPLDGLSPSSLPWSTSQRCTTPASTSCASACWSWTRTRALRLRPVRRPALHRPGRGGGRPAERPSRSPSGWRMRDPDGVIAGGAGGQHAAMHGR